MAAKKAAKKSGAKKKPAGITIHGTKPKKGERMTGTTGWKLAATKGKKRIFSGTLIDTVNKGNVRIAIFNVPK